MSRFDYKKPITAEQYAEATGGSTLQCACCGKVLSLAHWYPQPAGAHLPFGTVCIRKERQKAARRREAMSLLTSEPAEVEITVYDAAAEPVLRLFAKSLGTGLAAAVAEKIACTLPAQPLSIEARTGLVSTGHWYTAMTPEGLENAARRALATLL